MAAAAKVRDLNSKYPAEGQGVPVTTRFSPDGIALGDPGRIGWQGAYECKKTRRGQPPGLGLE